MKFRGSSKIKYEHNMIPGLRNFLESIEAWEEITSIIPGKISPAKSHGRFIFQIQYDTLTGIKCLAKADDAVQEIFIISSSIVELNKKLLLLCK